MAGSFQVVDTVGFTRFCRDLSSMSGTPMHRVILSEGGKILEKCIGSSPGMSALRINRIARRFVARANTFAGPLAIGQGKGEGTARHVYPRISVAPGVGHHWWIEAPKAGAPTPTFYIMKGGEERHWNDRRWAAYQAMEAERKAAVSAALAQLPRIRASRGVAKASWLQIGDDLGLTLAGVPGYVRNARPRQGPRIDGVGRKIISPGRFFIELENHNQMLISRLRGAGILQRAVDGRRSFFNTNMRKGVFQSIESAAKKYPGIFLQAA